MLLRLTDDDITTINFHFKNCFLVMGFVATLKSKMDKIKTMFSNRKQAQRKNQIIMKLCLLYVLYACRFSYLPQLRYT